MKRTRLKFRLDQTLPLPFPALPPRPAPFTVLLKLHRTQAASPRRISFTHCPGPSSPILLKIVATETYAANTARRNRRQQFCQRLALVN